MVSSAFKEKVSFTKEGERVLVVIKRVQVKMNCLYRKNIAKEKILQGWIKL